MPRGLSKSGTFGNEIGNQGKLGLVPYVVLVSNWFFLVAIAATLILCAIIDVSSEERLKSREGAQPDEVAVAIKYLRRKVHHFRVEPHPRRVFLWSTRRVWVHLGLGEELLRCRSRHCLIRGKLAEQLLVLSPLLAMLPRQVADELGRGVVCRVVACLLSTIFLWRSSCRLIVRCWVVAVISAE
jgi:hypothetical protein